VTAMFGLGLSGLFLSGLAASTLLPMASEPVLVAYLFANPQVPKLWPVLAIGIGNTLGGVMTYWMGRGVNRVWNRWFASKDTAKRPSPRVMRLLDRYGPAGLFFSWLPVVGDPLCLAAGSLRLAVVPCVAWIAAGKFARYATLAYLVPVG